MFHEEKNENNAFRAPSTGVHQRPPAAQPTQAEAEIWRRVRERLRAELGEDIFQSWFQRIELLGCGEDVAHLSVATRFLKSWIQAQFHGKLKSAFARESTSIVDVALWVRGAGQQRAAPARASAATGSAPAAAAPAADLPAPRVAEASPGPGPRAAGDGLTGSPLDRKLTFQTFIVGQSNAFAHAAAQQAARAATGELPLYNPLYIHAAVGLGKTHLCQALAHQVESCGRRVVYLTAERFMYGFVAALKAQTSILFKERLRGIDLLVIDDLQFLNGKAIQQEFCHTLNALIDAGKQVVVASDRAPIDLETVEERMRTRLQGGLVVEMGALDEGLRVNILQARIAAARTHLPTFEVRPEVIVWLARQLTANGRDLEGAVNRMLAHATLTGQPLDLPTAEIAIKDLIRQREPRKVRIEDIQRLVAGHYNVSKSDILSARRTASVVRPRQIAMFLSKSLTLRSLPEIGRRFGGRDHTTVLHAVRKIETLMDQDQQLAGDVDLLKRMLLE
jgi:chromosomal replication initiator protein